MWGSEFTYLLGVPDPWSLDPKINPRYYAWTRTVSQAQMAQAFALPNVVSYTVDAITQTNSVLSISAYSADGRKATLSGEVFRSRTKLPSTWIKNNLQPVVIVAVVRECQENRVYRRALCAM